MKMNSELTPTQRKNLRSVGRTLQPRVTIGKAGINEGVLTHIRGQLTRLELIKVRLPASDAAGRAEAAKQIADGTGATLVDLVGRNALLYRPNDQLPAEKRIHLSERQRPLFRKKRNGRD